MMDKSETNCLRKGVCLKITCEDCEDILLPSEPHNTPICPSCGGSLRYESDGKWWICDDCHECFAKSDARISAQKPFKQPDIKSIHDWNGMVEIDYCFACKEFAHHVGYNSPCILREFYNPETEVKLSKEDFDKLTYMALNSKVGDGTWVDALIREKVRK